VIDIENTDISVLVDYATENNCCHAHGKIDTMFCSFVFGRRSYTSWVFRSNRLDDSNDERSISFGLVSIVHVEKISLGVYVCICIYTRVWYYSFAIINRSEKTNAVQQIGGVFSAFISRPKTCLKLAPRLGANYNRRRLGFHPSSTYWYRQTMTTTRKNKIVVGRNTVSILFSSPSQTRTTTRDVSTWTRANGQSA